MPDDGGAARRPHPPGRHAVDDPRRRRDAHSRGRAAVTAAFDGLFAPNPDAGRAAVAPRGRRRAPGLVPRPARPGRRPRQPDAVRIDSFDHATADTVDVTFSILLNGAVVLDALPGQAKLVDGTWLVTTKTYCQVATLGVDTIPEACR